MPSFQRSLMFPITRVTGCGKTYLACALGMEACKQRYNVCYIRLPELLLEMKIAHESNLTKKILQKYTKPRLLILDEWLLVKVPQDSQYDLLELIHHRSKGSSTIFCSQFRTEGWYEQLGGPATPLAEAILDRIVHTAYKINIKAIDPTKDVSIREVYSLKSTQQQYEITLRSSYECSGCSTIRKGCSIRSERMFSSFRNCLYSFYWNDCSSLAE